MTLYELPVGDIGSAMAVLSVVGKGLYDWRKTVAESSRRDARFDAAEAAIAAATLERNALRLDLTEHKLEVARRYVANDMLEKVEARLFAAIDAMTVAVRDLGARLDRAFEHSAR